MENYNFSIFEPHIHLWQNEVNLFRRAVEPEVLNREKEIVESFLNIGFSEREKGVI